MFVASGPDDSTYWCLFVNLGKTYHGDDVPCRGAKAEAEFSRKYHNHPITANFKYSELREATPLPIATPLHEYVIKKWHSKRCIVVGDSAHKVRA